VAASFLVPSAVTALLLTLPSARLRRLLLLVLLVLLLQALQ
jgi:hypothetical protein